MDRELIVAMTMVVRDEEDILATNLDYHLAQGVDLILVTDFGSTDRTSAILAEYARGGRVRCWREEGNEFKQPVWVSRMLKIARDEHGADWVLHGDADEFWVPLAGSLRDVCAAVPELYGYLHVRRHNFPPPLAVSEPFPEQMTIRCRMSTYMAGGPIHPKVAQRPAAGTMPYRGNHYIMDPVLPAAPDAGSVEIHHFQVRGYEGLLRRMRRAEETGEVGEGLSPETRAILRRYRAGELPAVYAQIALSDEQAVAGLESGELVHDDRVRRFLAGHVREQRDSTELEWFWAAVWAHAEKLDRRRRRRMRWRAPLRALASHRGRYRPHHELP
jgi:hypothetical protein